LEIINAEGVLRVVRDVTVHWIDHHEFLVISSEAGVTSELLTIHFANDGNKPIPVRVVDSRPTMVNGAVRHQLRLTTLDGAAASLDRTGDGSREAE
jgi:hypothetical protein